MANKATRIKTNLVTTKAIRPAATNNQATSINNKVTLNRAILKRNTVDRTSSALRTARTATGHLKPGDSSMAKRAGNTEHTMPVTHKAIQDTSTTLPSSLKSTHHANSLPSGAPTETRGYDQQQYAPQHQGQYNQQQQGEYGQPQGVYGQQQQQQQNPNAPFDPNAPEGERGLGGALLGATAGGMFGHKQGHGILGAIGGAIAGNFLGDKVDDYRHKPQGGQGHQGHHGKHGHHSQGGSSWGGKW